MNRGGRPIDPVWQHFYKVERDNNKVYAKCKYCGNIRSNHVVRMKSHLSQCLQNRSSDLDEVNFASGSESKPTEPETQAKRSKLDSFVVKTSGSSAQKLDLLVAKFFYANNIPFSVVEHATFQDLISALRPGYHVPSRKALAGSLLDEVAAEVEEVAKKSLEGKNVTLIEDGWSNIHNDPIIASCLHVSGKAVFLDAIDCSSNVKNAEYHKEITENAIKKAKTKFGCKVTAFVTDNAKVMEKTRKLLQLEESTKDLIVYGCSSHWLNLLGQDLTPDAVIKPVIKIQKYFRNHHLPAGWLQEYPESVKPQLQCDTRWNSQLACIDTFLKNRPFFQKIVEEHEDSIERDIANLINNYNLYKQCKDLMTQIKPISVGLDKLQRDTATLADACSVWLGLAKEQSLQPHIETVGRRMAQALEPFHFLAYLLHPKYKGVGLTNAQIESARVWANEKIPDCLPLIIAFEACELPFPSSYFSESARSTNPVTWWKGISKGFTEKDSPAYEFINMAVVLHSCPASSASIERMFSNFGLIHSKIRNRLGLDKCSKLVMCYRMLRGSFEPEY